MSWLAIRAALTRGWAWATSPLGGMLIGIAAVLGVLWGSYDMGVKAGIKTERARWEAKVAADAKTIAELTAKTNAVTAGLRGAHEARAEAIATKTITLIRKVPVYVTPEDDARCPIPSGAVSLLNAAVSGEPVVAPSPGGSDQAASAVPLSAVVGFGIENTGIGQQWREESLTWRTWYAKMAAEWKARTAP